MFRRLAEAWGRLSSGQQVIVAVIAFMLTFGILVGAFAEPGPPGPAGPLGPPGRQGEQGPQGERGDVAERGAKGDTGDPGPRGEKGERGATGRQGERGEPGEPAPTPAHTPTPAQTPTLEVAQEIQTIVIGTMMLDPAVRDAAISQAGRDLSLALVIGPAVNEEYARQLGDSFVRMLKSLSQDDPPGLSIGTGIYNYIVAVHYPNGVLVAIGAKARNSDHIRWRER